MIIRPIRPATTTTAQPKSVPGRGAAIADIWIKDRWNDWALDLKQTMFNMEQEAVSEKMRQQFYLEQIKIAREERTKLLQADARDVDSWRDNTTRLQDRAMQSQTALAIANMEERGKTERANAYIRADAGKKPKVPTYKIAAGQEKPLRDALAGQGYSTVDGGFGPVLSALETDVDGPQGDDQFFGSGVAAAQEIYPERVRANLNAINNDPDFDGFTPEQKLKAASIAARENMRNTLVPGDVRQQQVMEAFEATLDNEGNITNSAGVGGAQTESAKFRPAGTRIKLEDLIEKRRPIYEYDVTDEEGTVTPRSRLDDIDAEIARLTEAYQKGPGKTDTRTLRERARETYGREILGRTGPSKEEEFVRNLSPDQLQEFLRRARESKTPAQAVTPTAVTPTATTPVETPAAEVFDSSARQREGAAKPGTVMGAVTDQFGRPLEMAREMAKERTEKIEMPWRDAVQILRDAARGKEAFTSEQGKALVATATDRMKKLTDAEKKELDNEFWTKAEDWERIRRIPSEPAKATAAKKPAAQPAAKRPLEPGDPEFVGPSQPYAYPFERPSFFDIPESREEDMPPVPSQYREESMTSYRPQSTQPVAQQSAVTPKQQVAIENGQFVPQDLELLSNVAPDYNAPDEYVRAPLETSPYGNRATMQEPGVPAQYRQQSVTQGSFSRPQSETTLDMDKLMGKGPNIEPIPISKSTPVRTEFDKIIDKKEITSKDIQPISTDMTQNKVVKDLRLLTLAKGKTRQIVKKNDPVEIKSYFKSQAAREVYDLYKNYSRAKWGGGLNVQDADRIKIFEQTVLNRNQSDPEYWNALMANEILQQALLRGLPIEKYLDEQNK